MKLRKSRRLDLDPTRLTFSELVKHYADRTLFTFEREQNHRRVTQRITGAQLTARIETLAHQLQQQFQPDQRAVLLFPQGPDYIAALLACWHAGMTAVPTPIVDHAQADQIAKKTAHIVEDSGAACILADPVFIDAMARDNLYSHLPQLPVHGAPKTRKSSDATPIQSGDTALLLYTSGSTSKPKGVILTHRNIKAQALIGATQWDINGQSRVVSWMPQFHNFGLHFGILAPLTQGAESLILPPGAFVSQPEQWFEKIARFSGTHTAAPNFAFDLCVNYIQPAAVRRFSLETLRGIICGGEPVRKETVERFCDKFKGLGLKRAAFCPHYGLSETGSVTTKQPGARTHFLSLDIAQLERGHVKVTHRRRKHARDKGKAVASVGELTPGVTVHCVDPQTQQIQGPDAVGEIWVKSAAVGMGYRNREEESMHTFGGTLASGESGFLRTGDLGFIQDNHLFIVGRSKEVIIIHGKNHHPVDLEWTIQKHLADLEMPLAVFSAEVDDTERVMVVQEVPDSLPADQLPHLADRILAAVSEVHELELAEIALVAVGAIPKTGSGKIQRRACKLAYLQGDLPVRHRYQAATPSAPTAQPQPRQRPPAANPTPDLNQLQNALKTKVFTRIPGLDPQRLEQTRNIGELGLNSIHYVRLSRAIEDVFQIEFKPVMLFKHRTFEKLARYLADLLSDGTPTPPQTARQNQPIPQPAHALPPNQTLAVIGMACRFPGGVTDPNTYWDFLSQTRDGIQPIQTQRPALLENGRDHYGPIAQSFPAFAGFIDNADTFDAAFFRIPPREAESMDPQQRKALELIWTLFESAGYNPETFSDANVGLFLGVHNNDYAELVARRGKLTADYGAFLDSGLHMSMIAHRVSRTLNFHGPSEVINTACSSSLVALHHAVQSIQRGDSDIAAAGGINLIFSSRVFIVTQNAGMLAADGRCKTFDAAADGFVRAEGYGAVLLKPLDRARRDGDHIIGLIEGVVINHDGQSNSLRSPNLGAQKRLIQKALYQTGLIPEDITLLETHGTGTALGDPIEIQALREAFGAETQTRPHCALGSVKTQLGHAESAAGMAGLIKVLLALKHRTLPGLRHFHTLNPHINMEDGPFYLNLTTSPWPQPHDADGRPKPRRAGVSSFGFGGINAHAIVAEDPTPAPHPFPKPARLLFPVSAKTPASLQAVIRELADFFEQQDQNRFDWTAAAWTLQTGRAQMKHRFIALVRDGAELVTALRNFPQTDNTTTWRREGRHDTPATTLPNDPDRVRTWAVKDQLDQLAAFWVRGGPVDWRPLYGQSQPRRMPLPTYHFETKRFWLPETQPKTQPDSALLFKPRWFETERPKNSVPDLDRHVVVTIGWGPHAPVPTLNPNTAPLRGLAATPLDHQHAASAEASPSQRFQDIAGQLLTQIQAHAGKPGKTLLQVAFTTENDDQTQNLLTGLAGLLRTSCLEAPRLQAQLIQLDDPNRMAEHLAAEARDPGQVQVRYRQDARWTFGLEELSPAPDTNVFQDGAVVLITGGAGALGLVFAREIAARAKDVTLVLTGRTPAEYDTHPDGNRMDGSNFADLRAGGARVLYRALDVTDQHAVKALIDELIQTPVTGLIHAAGVIHDLPLTQKSAAQFQTVLDPKVRGLDVLDQATAHLDLDFFICFSSIAGVFGNSGQADYAAANAYMDAFAAYRNHLVSNGERRGRTLSLNLPLWAAGAMSVDAHTEKLLHQTLGMRPMARRAGLDAFYRAYAVDAHQVLLIAGDADRIRRKCLPTKTEPAPATATPPAPIRADRLERELCGMITKILGVHADDIEPELDFSEYGFDSVTFTAFAGNLNERYGLELIPPVFYELPSVRALAQHLLQYEAVRARHQAAGDQNPRPAAGAKAPGAPVQTAASTGANQALEPIAVIGMSGVFPLADDLDQFWANLESGRDCISEIPAERWDWREYWGDPDGSADKTRVKWGGFSLRIAEFDAQFFGITPREAAVIDPQQRLTLTHTWAAVEHAGYGPKSLAGSRTAVLVGTADTGYSAVVARAGLDADRFSATGLTPSMGPNRTSWFLGLHGPSEPIETGCSSSLVAVYRAVDLLQRDQIDLAVAGGFNTLVHPAPFICFSKAGMLSEDGRCKTFSDRADGYVRGEGGALLLLKPRTQAERDGDTIHGLILAGAENHGGRANSLTAPNPNAQTNLLVEAWTRAGIQADDLDLIEAHGTGTSLGDPIEIKGLQNAINAMGGRTRGPATLAVGSVKTNIGHLELAAGIAGLVKVLLQFKHHTLTPNLHAETLNPYLNLEGSDLYIQRETRTLPADQLRHAGVSSFGFGGANAHIVLQAYQPQPLEPSPSGPYLFPLSAKTTQALQQKVHDLIHWLAQHPETELYDLAFTLQTGRDPMEERLALAAESRSQLAAGLSAWMNDQPVDAARGRVSHKGEGDDLLDRFAEDEELLEAVEKWIQRGKHKGLLDFWTRGLPFDWSRLYRDTGPYAGARQPRRIPLPTYPFARERHWVQARAQEPADFQAGARHPLVHQNTSDIKGLAFTTRFTGSEFFLTDHRVAQIPVLPGAAYLEAVHEAAVRLIPGPQPVTIRDTAWVQPLQVLPDRTQMRIRFLPGRDAGLDWRVQTIGDNGAVLTHAMGWVGKTSSQPQPSLDLENLTAYSDEPGPDPQSWYRRIAQSGVTIGPAQQALRAIFLGRGYRCNPRLLAEYALPAHLNLSHPFTLHPAMLDAVFQTAVGYAMGWCDDMSSPARAALPFALERLEIYGPIGPKAWAWIRDAADSTSTNRVIDIDLCDEEGRVILVIRGLAARFLDPHQKPAPQKAKTPQTLQTPPPVAAPIPGLAQLQQQLVDSFAEAVFLDPSQVDVHKPFVDMGVDSITGVEWIQALNQTFDTRIQVTKIYDYPTMVQFTTYLADQLQKGDTHFPTVEKGETVEKGDTHFQESKGDTHPSPAPVSNAPDLETLQQDLIQSFADAVFMSPDQVDVHKPFVEMGVDSITGVEWVQALNKTHGARIQVTKIYDYPTMVEFTQFLQTQLQQAEKAQPTPAQAALTAPPIALKPIHEEDPGPAEPHRPRDAGPIAVVGMAGRFPKSPDLDTFWDNLVNGRDCISQIPETRGPLSSWYDPNPETPGKTHLRDLGILDDIDRFDPLFFNISPAEAELMDPQQRLFLESCWHCIEHAGLSADTLAGTRTGVFVGGGYGEYAQQMGRDNLNAGGLTGTASSVLSARISYLLNLKGPCMALDTACSSSLVALAQACNSLILGESDAALAGGVYINSGLDLHVMTAKAGMLSPNGRCFTFDQRADGFVAGEGVGVVLLKRLSDAQRHGNRILGLIRGWGLNQDGKTNGITAPSANSQIQLLKRVYDDFQIDPATISLIEAHGTGTKLGDPIEVNALVETYQTYPSVDRTGSATALASVKSNLGHLFSAAGISGFIKVMLAFEHQIMPPTIHFEQLNEHISLENSPFYINTTAQSWPLTNGVRRAAVSGFGISGTNAHLVLEAYAQPQQPQTQPAPVLFLLSAKTPERLRAQAAAHAAHLRNHPEMDPVAVAFTSQTGRVHFNERLALIAEDTAGIAAALESWLEHDDELTGTSKGTQGDPGGTDLELLAQAWRQGAIIDWNRLYTNKPIPVALPGYPFEDNRYWARSQTPPTQPQAQLHPLVHRNTSTFAAHRFTANLNADDLPHSGYRHGNQPVWSGPWILEAVTTAYRHLSDTGHAALTLDQITWGRPFHGESAQVSITFHTGDRDHRLFEVDIAGQTFARGHISLAPNPQEPPRHDLSQVETIQGRETGMLLSPKLLQTVLEGLERPAPLPVYLDQLTLFASNQPIQHAVVQPGETLTIDLCDDQGGVVARLHDLRTQSGRESKNELVFLKPVTQTHSDRDQIEIHGDHTVYLLQQTQTTAQTLAPHLKAFIQELPSPKATCAETWTIHTTRLFEFIKSRFATGSKLGARLFQVIVPPSGPHAATAAMLKTLHLENPAVICQTLIADASPAILAAALKQAAAHPEREVQSLNPQTGELTEHLWTPTTAEVHGIPWRDNTLWLITGGLGGLGRLFAKEIAARTQNTTLFLTGRKPEGQVSAQLAQLRQTGVNAHYRQMDVTDPAAVQAVLDEIRAQNQPFQGIIHAAGFNHDAFILKKESADFERVLAPKLTGTRILTELTRAEQTLEYFISFGSAAGIMGNAGQIDYAAANACLDQQAEMAEADDTRRFLTVNWPFWAEGGMALDHANQDQLLHSQGIKPLATDLAFEAFYRMVGSDLSRVLIFQGDTERIQSWLQTRRQRLAQSHQDAQPGRSGDIQGVLHLLKQRLGAAVKLEPERLDADEPLESYGIDSILITRLNGELAQIFTEGRPEELSKTLFYEYQTLNELAQHLAAAYPQTNLETTTPPQGAGVDLAPHLFPDLPPIQSPIDDKPAATTARADEPIAVIGLVGRYPMAADLDQFWDNLKAGRDCITEIPPERWSVDGWYINNIEKACAHGKSYGKWGGFLDNFADFDPLFFQIPPWDALNMDPQERLFVESAWHAVENAGYTRESLSENHGGRVGVFAGITKTGYALHGPDHWRQTHGLPGKQLDPHTSFASVANRVSYLLNLQGPSMPIDTMCSSSLTAVHEACEHIHRGECDLALAGGVNLYLHPSAFVILSHQKMLSPDGRCKSFGAGGNGFVPGEGVGLVLLKPLSMAQADHDRIHAVIRATAVNHGGKTNGYTVPNPVAQGNLIRAALDRAGLNARDISYIEAHGTGTDLGDPIEITGLTRAFRADTADNGFCALGSAKSNIGHLEAAAGIAGLTKIILQMQHGQLVPSLHTEELNPNIHFPKTPFQIQRTLGPWRRPIHQTPQGPREIPRLAGLSSFGAGGSNAHIIVEEYRAPNREPQPPGPFLILLSAHDQPALHRQAAQLATALQTRQPRLDDLAFTLQIGREAMNARLAMMVHTHDELVTALNRFLKGDRAGLQTAELDGPYREKTRAQLRSLTVTADLDTLRDLWLKGANLPWAARYGDNPPHRINLPAYPFNRRRFWTPEQQKVVEGVVGKTKTAKTQGTEGSTQSSPGQRRGDLPNPHPGFPSLAPTVKSAPTFPSLVPATQTQPKPAFPSLTPAMETQPKPSFPSLTPVAGTQPKPAFPSLAPAAKAQPKPVFPSLTPTAKPTPTPTQADVAPTPPPKPSGIALRPPAALPKPSESKAKPAGTIRLQQVAGRRPNSLNEAQHVTK